MTGKVTPDMNLKGQSIFTSAATKSRQPEKSSYITALSLAQLAPAAPTIIYEMDEMRDTIKREQDSVKKKKIELQDELVLTK